MGKYYFSDYEELIALRDENQRLEIELAQTKEELLKCQSELKIKRAKQIKSTPNKK